MRTVTVRLDQKTDVYAVLYGGFQVIEDKIRKALDRNVFKAHVCVENMTGGRVLEFDWFDSSYAARPTNPAAERLLAENVQHYDGLSRELDRTEWAAVAPETTMTWDYGNEDGTVYWQTPGLFARLGMEILRPQHKVFNIDVSA